MKRLPALSPPAWRLLVAVAACLLLSSCFLRPHRIDIQQGNYIDPETVARLKPGMTRSQVRFLLGTPLLTDAFHPDRWDYLYIHRRGGRLMEERRLTLWFEGDVLKRAVTDAPEVAANPPAAGARAAESQQGSVGTP